MIWWGDLRRAQESAQERIARTRLQFLLRDLCSHVERDQRADRNADNDRGNKLHGAHRRPLPPLALPPRPPNLVQIPSWPLTSESGSVEPAVLLVPWTAAIG